MSGQPAVDIRLTPYGIAVKALHEICEGHEPGTLAHDTAHKALGDYFAAVRESQPVPGLAALDVAVGALRAIALGVELDASGNGRRIDPSVIADKAMVAIRDLVAAERQPPRDLDDLFAEALATFTSEPKAAPELAAALEEPRELRKVIAELLGMFKAVSGGWGARTSSSRLRRLATRAMVPWDEFPPGRAVLGGDPDSTYRDEIAKLVEELKASATATRPSKKSGIEDSLIDRLQAILEGL